MKHRFWLLPLAGSMAGVACLLLGKAVAAPPKQDLVQGHATVCVAKVTFRDNTSKIMPLITPTSYAPTIIIESSGQTQRIWIDTISKISNIEADGSAANFKLKDGKDEEWKISYPNISLLMYTDRDTLENLELRNVKNIEFVKKPRFDKRMNPMFDQWIYSPFTGEKLPDVEP